MHVYRYAHAVAALLFVGLLLLARTAPAPGRASHAAGGGVRPSASPKRVAIRFLTDSDFPPFNYFDEDNVLTGFNVDMARAVCLELNAGLRHPGAPLGPADAGAGEGGGRRGDRLACRQPQHAQGRRFHRPLLFTPAPLRRQSAGPASVDVTPEGLEGKKIAVAKGTAHEAYLRAFFRDSAIRAFETVELARDALIAGTVDLLFDDGISLAFWLNGTASRACCEFKGGPFARAQVSSATAIGIAVNREDVELKRQINAALRRMRESGRYEELLLRYFPAARVLIGVDGHASCQRPAHNLLCPRGLSHGRALRAAQYRHRATSQVRDAEELAQHLPRGGRAGRVDDVAERAGRHRQAS